MNISKRDQGWSEYSFGSVHLRYDGSGFFAGKQAAEGTLILRDDANEFTSDSVNAFFDFQGNPQGTGCGSAVGTRFELNP